MKIIIWAVALLLLTLAVSQYISAAKYEALVQVASDDKIGVNPTDVRLDFGDLPKGRSSTRTVNLKSGGNTGSYVIVWKRGEISDLIKMNKNFFTLKPGTEEKLEFTIFIPDSAEYRYYKGKVVIFQIPKIW